MRLYTVTRRELPGHLFLRLQTQKTPPPREAGTGSKGSAADYQAFITFRMRGLVATSWEPNWSQLCRPVGVNTAVCFTPVTFAFALHRRVVKLATCSRAIPAARCSGLYFASAGPGVPLPAET